MDAFLAALSAMAMLFIVMALGFLGRKIGWFTDNFDSILSKATINIACPAMILSSVLSTAEVPSTDTVLLILGVSLLSWVVIIALAWGLPLLYRVPKNTRGAHQFTIAFGNTGFVGFAVVDAILGGNAVLYASIYCIPYNLLMFSVGMVMIASSGDKQVPRKQKLKNIGRNLLSPVMFACVIALFLLLFHVTDPNGIIGNTCELLGQMTAPAAMLVIGSTIAKFKFKDILTSPSSYLTTLLRLLLIPAVMYVVGSFFIADPFLLAVLVLIAGMPVANVGTMMCLMYGGDLATMSRCTFLTTVLSLITIPLVCAFVL